MDEIQKVNDKIVSLSHYKRNFGTALKPHWVSKGIIIKYKRIHEIQMFLLLD